MKKKGFMSRISEGKGFYIALIICVIAVGVGFWAVLGSAQNAGMKVTAKLPESNGQEDVFRPQTPVLSAAPAGTAAPASAKPETTSAPRSDTNAPTSYVWPVGGEIATPHSLNALIYDATMADFRTHAGIDIKCDLGASVVACADGTVKSVENGGMLGTTVTLEHGGGIETVYANLDTAVGVSPGDSLKAGAAIGKVGETTVSEAGLEPHLHFELRVDGAAISPADFLPQR